MFQGPCRAPSLAPVNSVDFKLWAVSTPELGGGWEGSGTCVLLLWKPCKWSPCAACWVSAGQRGRMVSPAMMTLSSHPALDPLSTRLIAVRMAWIAFAGFDRA